MALEDVDRNDVTLWNPSGNTNAISQMKVREVFASDGLCTDEQVHPADCLLQRHLFGCPKHDCVFDVRGTPKTYPSQVCAGLNRRTLRAWRMTESACSLSAAKDQAHLRSFQHTHEDGIGDLPDSTRLLDTVEALDVDGFRLPPLLTSRMRPMGHEVLGYRNIEPRFGTKKDFDALLALAPEVMSVALRHGRDAVLRIGTNILRAPHSVLAFLSFDDVTCLSKLPSKALRMARGAGQFPNVGRGLRAHRHRWGTGICNPGPPGRSGMTEMR